MKMAIGKNNNTRTVQAESSKIASLLFDWGFQIVIPPRVVASVPEPIGTPSDGISIDPIVAITSIGASIWEVETYRSKL
jgi:hypothetical protein